VQRRERSLPVVGLPEPKERWQRPEPGQGERYEIDIAMPGVGRIKGYTQFDDDNRMINFCLLSQVFHAADWWDVVKVDTCHDAIHAHFYYRTRSYDEKEDLLPITCIDDIDLGYRLADKLVIACFEEHVARWRDGL
jgi:hypothetical protein